LYGKSNLKILIGVLISLKWLDQKRKKNQIKHVLLYFCWDFGHEFLNQKDWKWVRIFMLSSSAITYKRSSPNRFGNELHKKSKIWWKSNFSDARSFAIETLTDPTSNTQQNPVEKQGIQPNWLYISKNQAIDNLNKK
jgi:hypothetical protein